MGGGFHHRAGGCEVIGKGVVHQVALPEARREQGPRHAPVVAPRAPGSYRGRATRIPGAAGAPANRREAAEGRAACCNSSSSDLRVTGRLASVSRLVMTSGSTSRKRSANAGARAWHGQSGRPGERAGRAPVRLDPVFLSRRRNSWSRLSHPVDRGPGCACRVRTTSACGAGSASLRGSSCALRHRVRGRTP